VKQGQRLQQDRPEMKDSVYIVLFRGVGGDTKLPSQPLREALSRGGFKGVSTYIATGNVVLISPLSAAAVKAKVAAIARRKLAFAKPVLVASRREWAAMIRNNPFPEAVDAPRTLHAFLLEGRPQAGAVEALATRATAGERLALKGRFLYLHTPEGFGPSKLPPMIDRQLGVATARNWNTVMKLREIADATAG
jgi:uncharacterized protein (DUF1697 family)